MARFSVMVTSMDYGFLDIEAEDEFEARCKVLDMLGESIEVLARWNDTHEIEVTDNIEPIEG